MIFASKLDNILILAAADSFAELEATYGKVIMDKKQRATYRDEYQPSLSDMLLDDRFNNFKKPPYVFEFADEPAIDVFIQTHKINVIPQRALVDKHLDMIHQLQVDPYLGEGADQRLIEEILGLEENDPWDHRTEEEKQQDEENKKEAEAAKKAGKLSGDSFGPSTKRGKRKKDGSNVNITDVRTTRNEDGSIEIDDVLAVKGLYDDNGKGAWLPTDAEAAAQEAAEKAAQDIETPDAPEAPVVVDAEPSEHFYRFTMAETDSLEANLDLIGELSEFASADARDRIILFQDDTTFVLRGERVAQKLSFFLDFANIAHTIDIVDAQFTVGADAFTRSDEIGQHIMPEGWVAIYHRVDVVGGDLRNIVPALGELRKTAVATQGQMLDHCWIACATKLGADEVATLIDSLSLGTDIEVYGVNDKGERLVPKGVQIVTDEVKEELPRPWNTKAAEWEALTDDQRKDRDMRITGKEFIFCGSYRGADGCILYITPRSYFNEHGEMWEGDLAIKLPDDLKKVRPGIYQTKSRSWIPLCQDLVTRGMIESLGLQLHINSMD